ncbi:tyrosine-protein kinase etk [Comamonadaceae bacterium OS-1]|nr:tyrosine-protein kinase etk [Comamonadaceae bacterium OS-1]
MDQDQLKDQLRLAGAAPGGAAQIDDPEEEFNFGEIIATVLEYKWLIVSITALAIALGIGAVFVTTPIFQADAVLQVDEKAKGGLSALKDLEPLLGESTSVSAELEILNSRMILGRAVSKLNLDIVAKPRYAPLVGRGVARRFSGDGLNTPLLGLAQYAWGGEKISVTTLDVSADREDDLLKLVAGVDGAYQLFDEDDALILNGKVGTLATGQGVSIRVAELKARPGTQFRVTRLADETSIKQLRDLFSAKERGKKSGILEVTLLGPDREFLPVVLDEIVNTYYRQNVERRAAEAENTLKFLEVQLPALKAQLDAAEAAYNNYRQSRGSVDLTIETESVLQSVVQVDTDIAKLRQEREELRQAFTSEHPRVIALDAKLALLKQRRAGFDQGVARLPDTQQTALRLKRDVEVSTTLYIGLLSAAQQLRVTKAGTVGDVRIIDKPLVYRLPVEPRTKVILILSAVLGLFASLALVWLLRMLRVAVDNPDIIEKRLGLPVYASIPHSKAEDALVLRAKKSKEGQGELLAVTQPDDDAIESLRSLRTTLHFALLNAPRNSILVTGPSQGIGKSFVSKNLAAVLAQSGKRVVVVDADLRKGHLHKEFGLPRKGGVSEYIGGTLELAATIHPSSVPGLSVVTTGQLPPNPSELLMHPRFEQLLIDLEGLFDIVIVDAPPVLAVSDAAIVGRMTGATLLVARSGRHPVRELEQTVKRLNQAGVQVKGFVFNDLDLNRQRYRYGYEGYVYRYSYTEKS